MSLILTFFGLPPSYKLVVHKQISDIVYHGGGGFSFGDVYSMPVHLRRFYYKDISDKIKEKNEAEDKATKGSSKIRPRGVVPPPTFARK